MSPLAESYSTKQRLIENAMIDTKIKPGSRVKLRDFDPQDCGEWKKEDGRCRLAENTEAINKLTYRLYAENRRSLLLVLQGMDTAGKDGTIRAVMKGINPQTCQVIPFKQPSSLELDHDFLWRIHREVPRNGNVGIFNRSHYEDVLVVRVHKLVKESVWRNRYDRINDFEKLLTEGGMTIVKCFLHISKDEQKERLQARLDNPDKRWKFSKADLSERQRWDDYQDAYEDALANCSTDWAPWHVIPSNRKWFRNLVVSELLRETLEDMDPQFPACDPGLDDVFVE